MGFTSIKIKYINKSLKIINKFFFTFIEYSRYRRLYINNSTFFRGYSNSYGKLKSLGLNITVFNLIKFNI